ncbi:hypothetical protein RHAB21_03614 [Pseudorhizobium halotolerans]|uniref:AmiS/UreI family transporter n=1 Tax=Pseudorhizobium halotolerans TaxID=1233081 RepID=A0ABN7JX95_9HYPH|nr:DUF6064 family protein [Pseudorhizobium halotolerans]CAD7045945.1 hypothetical protein RHAB21_03614 [Pseudorhizobium halotolerans]
MLPFARDQFLAVFAAYNQSIWPAQLFALALGVAIIYAVVRQTKSAGVLVSLGLGAMWLWTGLFYHLAFFSSINGAAYVFGAGFLLQGLLFLRAAARRDLEYGDAPPLRTYVGYFLAGYAVVLYPLIGFFLGHDVFALPAFGVTPCPVTIFTFGVLLLATRRVPVALLVVPLLWSLIGGSAAFLLDIPQDWMLLVSGVASLALLTMLDRDRRPLPRQTSGAP